MEVLCDSIADEDATWYHEKFRWIEDELDRLYEYLQRAANEFKTEDELTASRDARLFELRELNRPRGRSARRGGDGTLCTALLAKPGFDVFVAATAIVFSAAADVCFLFLRQLADDSRRHAHGQHSRRNGRPFGNEGAGRHDRTLADGRTRQQRCSHADERIVFNFRAVNNRGMTDSHAPPISTG